MAPAAQSARAGSATGDAQLAEARARAAAGDLPAARAIYRALSEAEPNNGGAFAGLGALAFQEGDVAAARDWLERAVALRPDDPEILTNLGAALAVLGRNDAAIARFRAALDLAPAHLEAWRNLLAALLNADHLVEAELAARRALAIAPNDGIILRRAATAFRRAKKLIEAERLYRFALALSDGDARSWTGLGQTYLAMGRLADAIVALQRAVTLDPQRPDLMSNLGNALRQRGEFAAAIDYHQRAIAGQPKRATPYINYAAALHETGRHEAAAQQLEQAVALEPGNFLAWRNLGGVYETLRRPAEAMAALRRAYALDPKDAGSTALLFHALSRECLWPEAAPLAGQVALATAAALAQGEQPEETSFAHLFRSADMAEHLALARSCAAAAARRVRGLAIARPTLARDPERRLRVGYFSSDFNDHPVAHLTAGLFECHDRAAVEIIAYAHGRDDGSDYRQRIRRGADRFVDLRELGFAAAAQRIAEDAVDILIDLNGYTAGSRPEVLALRPAPIQALWLGYPATMGADFVDYMITDRVVTPLEHQAFFAERFLYLPGCFQPNDDRQPIAETPATRAAEHLPETAFVFCSFNQSLKIDRDTFAIWMALLRETADAVLWLPFGSPNIAATLQKAAADLGVAPQRLIFADRPSKDRHLRRLQLADLALDTLIYNGHTTSSDALWAGLPVLTALGPNLPARVTASLLTSLGLPELIAASPEDYRRCALELARDRAKLVGLRQRLAKARLESRLYDTGGMARQLERLYRAIWRRHCRGEAPAAMALDLGASEPGIVEPGA